MSVLSGAREHIERSVKDLEGEEDFPPFLICRNDKGEDMLTLLDMPDEEHKDGIADIIVAIIAVWQSNEALFGSCAWTVESASRDLDGMMPSEHPDRREMAFMLHVTPDGGGLHRAMMRRVGGKVELEPWLPVDDHFQMGGRFSDAMKQGLWLARHLPPEIKNYIDEHLEEDPQALIEPLVRAIGRYRREPGIQFSVN